MQNPVVTKKTPTALPEDLLQRGNSRYRTVVDILTQLGLQPLPGRGKGDHTVWRDPSGQFGQTVVPAHKEIALGTRKSMGQAIASK